MITRSAIILCLAVLCNFASAQNLIVNGSFEVPELAPGHFQVFSQVPGWTAIDSLELIHPTGPLINGVDWDWQGELIDGKQIAETRGVVPGGARQDVPTIPNQRYALSFWYANHPLALTPPETEVELMDISTSQLLVERSFSPELTSSLSDPDWKLFQLEFTAIGETTRLSIQSGPPASDEFLERAAGAVFDNVVMTVVPEPSTTPLASISLLIVAALRLRRAT